MSEFKPSTELIVCTCYSPEHQIIIKSERFDNEIMTFVDVHLVKLPLFKRIKYAIKYIFGYKCKYGAFDELLLGPEHITQLENVVNTLKLAKSERENNKTNIT